MTVFWLKQPSGDIYTIDNMLYASRMRVSALEGTPNKSDLMNSGGLNRFMTVQPRTYSTFLNISSLAAHRLTAFKTSTMNIKTTIHYGHMQL